MHTHVNYQLIMRVACNQTSLFSVTGTTRIRLSELSAEQWEQVVSETKRTREDIDAALDAMLRRQELPGGRVPVQTTERLFRESVPLLRQVLEGATDDAGTVATNRLDRILLAIEGFNFASLPYDDLFLVWNYVGTSEGRMELHESLRCVYSVLGQVCICACARASSCSERGPYSTNIRSLLPATTHVPALTPAPPQLALCRSRTPKSGACQHPHKNGTKSHSHSTVSSTPPQSAASRPSNPPHPLLLMAGARAARQLRVCQAQGLMQEQEARRSGCAARGGGLP